MERQTALKDEIKAAVDALRNLSDELSSDSYLHQALMDSDAACEAISETNAFGWGVDEIDVVSVEPWLVGPVGGLRVTLDWRASGDQDQDHMYCGDAITGKAVVFLGEDGTLTVEKVSGGVVRPEEPEGPEEPEDVLPVGKAELEAKP